MDDAGGISASSVMVMDSISFGRFESDSSLAWERWSVFSRNRLMEEVQKYAVPGTVAQKKAYFDAYYKRKRAQISAESLTTAENEDMSPISENCSADSRTNAMIEDSGAVVAGNAQEANICVDETSEIDGLNRFDSCKEESGSCNKMGSSSDTMVVGKIFSGDNRIQAASGGSREPSDIFEDQNQMTGLQLQISNKAGRQPLKESFDINKEVPIADGPKKTSLASPMKPYNSGIVGMPKKSSASPAKHLKSPSTVPKKVDHTTPNGKSLAFVGTPMKPSASPAKHITPIRVSKKEGHATPNSKGLGSCISIFRNKAIPKDEDVVPRTPIDKNTTLSARLNLSNNRNDRTGSVIIRSSTIQKIEKIKSVTGFFRTSYCVQSEPVCLLTKESVSNSSHSATKTVDSKGKRDKPSCFSGIRESCKNLAASFRLRTEERTSKHKEFSQKLEQKTKAEEAKKIQYRNKNKLW